MKVKVILKLLVVLLISLSSTQIIMGQSETESKTNEIFLRESIQELLMQTFIDFPEGDSRLVFVRSESENPANWLLEEELTSYLGAKGYSLALPQKQVNSDKFENCWDLFYRIIELRLEYPKVKSKRLFGQKFVHRESDLNISFRLTQKNTGKILWIKRKNHFTSDVFPKKVIPTIQSGQYSFLSPELPENATGKYLEPALVAAVVGGLVYLFFASR